MRQQGALAVPVTISQDGGMMIDVSIDGSAPVPFILDTGSTTTAVFEDARERYGLAIVPDKLVEVRDLITTSMVPVAVIDSLQISGREQGGLQAVVLKSRLPGIAEGAAGLIGLDVLKQHTLAYHAAERTLYLLPPGRTDAFDADNWNEVALNPDPYDTGLRILYFADMEIDLRTIPALIDTGAVRSSMNWEGVRYYELLRIRRMLQSEWEAQGAVGEFTPIAFGIYGEFRLGGYRYYVRRVIINEFDSYNITGKAGEPLFIAGADLFRDKDFVFDFTNSRLFMSIPSRDPKSRLQISTHILEPELDIPDVQTVRPYD